MNKFKKMLTKLIHDESGMESVEVALSIALIAAIAGFGMIVLGDALASFFDTTASSVGTANTPCQGDTTLGTLDFNGGVVVPNSPTPGTC